MPKIVQPVFPVANHHAFRSTMPISGRRPMRGPLRQLGHTAYHHTGDYITVGDYIEVGDLSSDGMRLLGMAAVGAGAYHGYKRTGQVKWAIAWGLLAALAPVITTGVAIAQGFGKRKGGS